MVERWLINDLVTFRNVELDLQPGLVVLTGPSGAGKSVLLGSLLSLFGYDTQAHARLCEVSMTKPPRFDAEGYELDDELVVKQTKKEKLRYFLNAQSISKKRLKALFAPYVKYLGARQQDGLESDTLLRMIDAVAARDKVFAKSKKEFAKRYRVYLEKKRAYDALVEQERTLAERREFLRFEIDKIAAVDPKPGEEEELLAVKKRLSRLDKLDEAIQRASQIFAYETAVETFYTLTDGDGTLFAEAMNRLRADLEAGETMRSELEEINVEEVLDRLGELNGLIKRFGSLEEALAYKREKEEELARTERVEADKTHLERYLELEYAELTTLAQRLSAARKEAAKTMETELRDRLDALRLPPLRFVFQSAALYEGGIDRIDITMEGSGVSTLSGGEFNRVRLALRAVSAGYDSRSSGIIVLDEIDANVSGDESIAIAELIETLASRYQVFAISHQPHLTAKAHQHLLVRKEEGESRVIELDEKGRIAEIARIVGGENPSSEAEEFARKLRGS